MTGRAEILFCVMFLVQLSVSLCREHIHFGAWLNLYQDGDFYTFEWIVKVSIKQCVEACKFTKACKYINYEVRTHKCGLIRAADETNNIAAVSETKPGYIFGKKSEWITVTSNVCDTCSDYGNCHVDDTSESDISMCRNSGCRKPDANFHGNMFSVEGRIRQSCKEGSDTYPLGETMESLECRKNGQWLADKLPVCPAAYFSGSNYSIQTVSMTWYDAKANCERLSGHLIDINSAAEQTFLEGLVKDHYKTWTGGNDLDVEGTFLWSDGSTVSSGYINWFNVNPNNAYGNEHCLLVMVKRGFQWNDGPCNNKYTSVCEF